MEFTRFTDTILPKREARIVSVTITPTIQDCSGNVWFTDVMVQEGDKNTGYVLHTSVSLARYERNGEPALTKHFNGIVRSSATVVLPNNSITPSGNTVIIDNTPQVSCGLDCYIYPVQAMEAGSILLATGAGNGSNRCRFTSTINAGDEFTLLATRRLCQRNGSATGKHGFYQYLAFGDNQESVKVEEDKSALLLFRFRQRVQGSEAL